MTGVDYNSQSIAYAKEQLSDFKNVSLVNKPINTYLNSLEDHSVDIIFTSATLFYCSQKDLEGLFEQLQRKTKKLIIFETVDSRFPFFKNTSSALQPNQFAYTHDYPQKLINGGFQLETVNFAPIWLNAYDTGESALRNNICSLLIVAHT